MKRLLLLSTLLMFCLGAYAQSQRMVIIEEFTGENCGPCAIVNPIFDPVWKANTTQATVIKYQCAIPSAGPVLYAQTKTDVDSRNTYYSNQYAPWAYMDGNKYGGSAGGGPATLSASIINTEYGVTSPFDINLTHSISPDADSIYITMIITASGNFTTANSFKAHIALVEKEITFLSSPGSNGEKEFRMVMRKMYPSASGTTLASNWTAGQADTITVAAALPSYIYQVSELAVVGFVQDNADKNIKQGAISQTVPVQTDVFTKRIYTPPVNCTGNFTPTFTLKNLGTDTLKSVDISYKVDAGTPVTQTWTGALAEGDTAKVTLGAVTAAAGNHSLTVTSSNPNGTADFGGNNTSVTHFNIMGAAVAAPVYEGFASTSFPPAGWLVDNRESDAITWKYRSSIGGFGNSSSSTRLACYNSPRGNVDELFLPAMDLTGLTEQYLIFSLAYAPYKYDASNSSLEELSLKASINCGASWLTLWSGQGEQMQTANPTTSEFIPSATEWSLNVIDLKNYLGKSSVLFKFTGTSDYGNDIYLDDINVSASKVGIKPVNSENADVRIFPNPANDYTTLNINLAATSLATITLTNLLGEAVYTTTENLSAGLNTINLTTAQLSAGIYQVSINANENVITKKLVVVK